MYDGCCSVSKVTTKKQNNKTKKVARKSRQKIEAEGDDDKITTKKGRQKIQVQLL